MHWFVLLVSMATAKRASTIKLTIPHFQLSNTLTVLPQTPRLRPHGDALSGTLSTRPRHLPVAGTRCCSRCRSCSCEIGRASCRERVCQYVKHSVVAGTFKKKQQNE